MSLSTSIRLDDESRELVKDIPNLSHYVRGVIKSDPRLRRIQKEEHLPGYPHALVTFCHPFGGNHLCLVCWPDGAPSKDDWKYWSKEQMMHRSRSRTGIFDARPLGQGREKDIHLTTPDQPPQNEGEDAATRIIPKKGLIRRFISFFW